MRLGEARAPDGIRLYAVGDVHGRDDLLDAAHRRIEADLADRPTPDYRLIHLGDYIDRGPDSRAAVERLRRLTESDGRVVCLQGNHEQLLLDFLADPAGGGPNFLANGGTATMESYGVSEKRWLPFGRNMADLAGRLAEAMPPGHRAFLRSLDLAARFGDFFFCHAGVRPGIPLEDQDGHDLIWIRESFLRSDADFGAVVVHGHTPAPEPEIRPNRINIDTGAVFSGRLTAIAVDGNVVRFL